MHGFGNILSIKDFFFNFPVYAYIDDCGCIIKQTNQNCQTFIVLAFNYLNLFAERVTLKSNINEVFLCEHNTYNDIYL
jgi:hypothetical protein